MGLQEQVVEDDVHAVFRIGHLTPVNSRDYPTPMIAARAIPDLYYRPQF